MPNPISGIACADNYTDEATIGPLTMGSNGGYFIIADNDVFMQLGYKEQGRGVSDIQWMPETHVPLGNGVFYKGTYSARFRNFTPGNVATVSGGLATPTQPLFTISAGGIATPSVSNMITGGVNANGSIAAGTGFTVNHSGTGIYVISFNTAYSSPPNIQVTLVTANTGSNAAVANLVTGWTGSSFTVRTIATGTGTLTDLEFTFLAQASV